MKLHEKFNYKVQSEFLDLLLRHVPNDPIVTIWAPGFYYLTINRRVFYIIPVDEFFLTEKLYKEPYSLGIGNCQCLRDVYYDELHLDLCTETGRMQSSTMGDIYREFECKSEVFYINWTLMKCFPKQLKFAAFDPNGPIFIYSSLNTLLGGVWPTPINVPEPEPLPQPELDIIGET